MSELKPCPECKGTPFITIDSSRELGDLFDEYFVECFECGHQGKISDNEDEAIELWNSLS